MDQLFSISDHVIVCGYGSTGQFVAKDLGAEGMTIVVVEKTTERASLAEGDGHLTLVGDVLDPMVLQEAGVERARGIVFSLPEEADNLFATMTARELNPDIFIIARHSSPHAKDKLVRAGADRTVNPFEETGRLIGNEFMRPAVTELMRIFSREENTEDEVRVREVTVDGSSPLVGQSLKDAGIRSRFDVMVIAMRKAGDSTRFNPDPERPFEAGDVLVCMGKLAKLRELHDLGRGVVA